ncbi:hypothetical protein FOA52_004491 [Chlamydomonas sp. UWO 241]|nr:hypothetical protein FOA52_004491 [Chlamydomonas sp. UWO 241]
MDGLPGADEQERILGESRNAVKRYAFQMRKACEEDSLRDSLRFCSAMLGELRTSQLSPQKYYDVYMIVFDQLVNLEGFFTDQRSAGRTYGELYELVQHAGNVLPRLYLMVTVGCLYIKSKEAKAKEILKDLVELCKGVQHPTRGLFLRAYLCQRSKAQAQQIASLVDVVSLLCGARAAPAAEAAQPARPAAAAAPVASAGGGPATERPASGATRAASARGPSRRGGLPARVGDTSLRRSFVLSIPVARGANWFLAGGGRRMDEEEATAAAAERIAAAAEDGTSLPVRLATDVVRFLYGGTGRREPADGGVVSASLLNAKPAVGGIGVEPRGGGVLRVLFTVASDAVADTVVRWRHELRRCVDSTAVFDVLSDREEAQHQALWPAFLAAKVAGKRAQFHRARLVVDGERGLLPDTGSEYEGPGGNVHDAIDFLLSNFIEMNKLWVRMQHQGHARDRDKRETERQQLQDLVGKNLTYLSQLDGLGYELYAGMVLPRVVEQIVSCKDGIAQQYLMQAVIQGFPDSFHLGTLDVLLGTLPELQPDVKVHAVMSSLMDRLARYAQAEAPVMERLLEMKAFERFRDAVDRVIAAQLGMSPADKVEMFVALLNFSGSVLPSSVENVNAVLSAAHSALSASGGLSGDAKAERGLVALLTIPITKYDVVTGLGLTEYPLLMGLLRHRTHKDLATKIILTIVEGGTQVGSVEKVSMLFRFIAPLVRESTDGGDDDLDDDDMEREQVLVARLLHSLHSPDPAAHFALLETARSELMAGGPRRVRHTLPALAFAGLALVRRLAKDPASALPAAPTPAPPASAAETDGADNSETDELAAGAAASAAATAATSTAAAAPSDSAPSHSAATVEAVLQWVLRIASILSDVASQPLLALRVLLAGGYSASEEARAEMLAYTFFEEAFTLYEESVPDQRHRTTALYSIIGSLQRCSVFGADNRAVLVTNASGYAARLLKRGDQCRAACACAHLSWQAEGGGGAQVPVRDAAKVMASLKRAIKIAHAAKQQAAAAARTGEPGGAYVELYIEVLNQHLYFFDRGVEGFSTSAVQALIDLIQGELSQQAVSADVSAAWSRAAAHISSRVAGGGGGGDGVREKYLALSVRA